MFGVILDCEPEMFEYRGMTDQLMPPPPATEPEKKRGGCLKKLFVGFAAFVVIAAIAGALGGGEADTTANEANSDIQEEEVEPQAEVDESTAEAGESESEVESNAVEPDFVMPTDRSDGEGDPFWQTSFIVEFPSGSWEAGDGFECRPIDEDNFSISSENGSLNLRTIVFDRSPSEIVGGVCQTRGAIIVADFQSLGASYTFSNSSVTGTISDIELLSGQEGGTDGTLTFELTEASGSTVEADLSSGERCTNESLGDNSGFDSLPGVSCAEVLAAANLSLIHI